MCTVSSRSASPGKRSRPAALRRSHKDVMAFKLNGGSPVDMLRMVLTGPSSREPNRRSNAVMLSILHDTGSKLINIDPLFYFIQSHMELALPKLLHGTSIPDTRLLPPRPSPPRLSAVPQHDEDIHTVVWLSLVDAKLLDVQEWHAGRRNKRPTPLYGDLETILPHLRPFFAAGGVLDMRGGAGSVIDMCDAPDYASSWNLPFVNVMLAKSKDRQIRDLWCDGIDMLDDLHWDAESSVWVWRPLVLNGVCANLLSAYGLEKNGPTSSPESQNVSDRVATELASFIANDPPLYSPPTIVGLGVIGSRLRFQTAP